MTIKQIEWTLRVEKTNEGYEVTLLEGEDGFQGYAMAFGLYSALDAAAEIVSGFYPEVMKGKPASFTDIAFDTGSVAEYDRIMKRLASYFELTRFSQEVEGAPRNDDWDAGFQAAMAIAKGRDA